MSKENNYSLNKIDRLQLPLQKVRHYSQNYKQQINIEPIQELSGFIGQPQASSNVSAGDFAGNINNTWEQ